MAVAKPGYLPETGSSSMGPRRVLSYPILSYPSQRRKQLRDGSVLTASDFFDSLPRQSFLHTLCDLRNFSRGLPDVRELQDPQITAIFKELLMQGTITRDSLTVDKTVATCHRRGWIHSDLDSDEEKISFTFASPLHGMYISWMLVPNVVECSFASVRDMTFQIIKNFN
jgi:hypothetical protein